MTTTYRVLAYTVAALVAVQAAVSVWASSGMSAWIADGGVLDQATIDASMEGEALFAEQAGFAVHAVAGMFLIPLVALALLVVSFLTGTPRATGWAAVVLALVIVQVALGMFASDVSIFGLLHGLNALILFASAALAIRATRAGLPSSAA